MEIRRIKKVDCVKLFETGNRRFDFDPNGSKLTFDFYYKRDKSGTYQSYILEDNGRILGVLCTQKYVASLHISRLGIHKNYHRKGYGSQLIKFAILKARQLRLDKISLETEIENIPFYEGMGFKTTRKYHDPHWGDSASMELAFMT